MNFLEGRAVAADGGLGVALDGIGTIRADIAPGAVPIGNKVTIGIRPEHVVLGHRGTNDVTFAAMHSEQLGGATTLHFQVPPFAAQISGQVHVTEGEAIKLSLPPLYCHVFDADGRSLARMPTGSRAASAVTGPSE